MAAAGPQTPAAPGFFANTPARHPSMDYRQQQPIPFDLNPRRQSEQGPVAYPNLDGQVAGAAPPPPVQKSMTLIERAAKTINDKLDEASRYPSLDVYLSQSSSGDYNISNSPAWTPFQKTKTYEIPDQVLEQYNNAQFSTSLGLFAEIGHVWVAIDNSLYLWDYTHPNPEVLGYEEAQSGITCVQLVKPRPGIFVASITHIIVIATSTDIQLVGVASAQSELGTTTISLYRTDMRTQTNRTSVDCIVGSAKTGRIFFGGRSDNEVYELTYQQEDSWFKPKCAKICHTRSGARSYIPSNPFAGRGAEHVADLVVDDTRDRLYALSSTSAIRAFRIKGVSDLPVSLERSFSSIYNELIHRTPQNDVISTKSAIVSLSPITSQEASRLWLMATLSTGVRVYFSGVAESYMATRSDGLSSLQVHHVRFPPADAISNSLALQPAGQSQGPAGGQLATNSQALVRTTRAFRYQPGYFACFVERGTRGEGQVFLTAPDSGRISSVRQDPSQYNHFPESGQWIAMEMPLEAGVTTPPFSASLKPDGFGNEPAVQFDKPATELAVLTNSSVTTFRRRRLVDVFASTIRFGGLTDGLSGEIRNFAHRYGRGETIASALAVACGQASDVGSDARVAKVTDSQILQAARETFIGHGGRPEADQNATFESGIPTIDQIRPSPRHEGLALYMSRLLRSVWRANIIETGSDPTGALKVASPVPASKLQGIQRDLVRLQEFLNANKSAIAGLSGPEALGRIATRQEEVALQAEHRALNSLLRLIGDVIEGMSFVLVLFEENMANIILSLSETSREALRTTTYEKLFCTVTGKDLAKELVKAIVNRNIADGMNIDTVTDALRRRCGTFCSAEDCVIFKAQEQLKRAADPSTSTENSRNLLNQSVGLLTRVAGSLAIEQLRWATAQYINQQFYGGAIQLILSVANEQDRGNTALSWFKEGRPGQDPREVAFNNRQHCYNMIHDIVNAVDGATGAAPESIDGEHITQAKRRREAYEVIDTSQDELFHTNLYDWYLANGWADRILNVLSPYVVSYLSREATSSLERADLLSKYFTHHHDFVEAARVQLVLARSIDFSISLEARMTYLSYARANASTKAVGLTSTSFATVNGTAPHQTRPQLLREISDLLELAAIQADIFGRIKIEHRIAADRIPVVAARLDGPILPVDTLYNEFADPCSYYDVCLAIYQAADHRNASDIKQTWQSMFETVHDACLKARAGEIKGPSAIVGDAIDPASTPPWAVMDLKVRGMGARLGSNEALFPVPTLVSLLYQYLVNTNQYLPLSDNGSGRHNSEGADRLEPANDHFVPSLFLSPPLSGLVAPETVVGALEHLFYTREVPFRSRSARRMITRDLVHACQVWFDQTRHAATGFLGGLESAEGVLSLLQEVLGSDGAREEGVGRECGELVRRVQAALTSM